MFRQAEQENALQMKVSLYQCVNSYKYAVDDEIILYKITKQKSHGGVINDRRRK